MLDDRPRALALIDRVTQLEKDNPMVAYHVGWTFEKLGDRERALIDTTGSKGQFGHLKRHPRASDIEGHRLVNTAAPHLFENRG